MGMVLHCIVTWLSWLLSLPWKLAHAISGVMEAVKKKLSDPYFIDFHSELNDQNANHERRPKTEWINMGYWKVRFTTGWNDLRHPMSIYRIRKIFP